MLLIAKVSAYGKRGPLFEGYIGDRLVVSGTTQPLLDAARVLLAEGTDPQTRLAMRHQGASHDALAGKIGDLAKLTVHETERGILFRRWEPSPSGRGVSRIDETQDEAAT